MLEHPLLLAARLADEHRPLELREVAPNGRARAGDEDVADLEHEVPRQSMWNRRVATDLSAVAGVRSAGECALRAVDLADRIEHRERRLVARPLRDLGLSDADPRVPLEEPVARLPQRTLSRMSAISPSDLIASCASISSARRTTSAPESSDSEGPR